MNRFSWHSLFTVLLLILSTGCATEFRPIEGVTVPRNLDEACVELDRMLTDAQKDTLRSGETEVKDLVLTFGMQLKEYWGLWKDSKIATYLRKRDIEHPDQMVAVIFNHYVAYLRSEQAP